jgi:hypothetical protein
LGFCSAPSAAGEPKPLHVFHRFNTNGTGEQSPVPFLFAPVARRVAPTFGRMYVTCTLIAPRPIVGAAQPQDVIRSYSPRTPYLNNTRANVANLDNLKQIIVRYTRTLNIAYLGMTHTQKSPAALSRRGESRPFLFRTNDL